MFYEYFFQKVAPTIFTQVFTILGYIPAIVGNPNCKHVALPLVYALMSSKEEEQYNAVFESLHATANEYGIEELEPSVINSDFELAIINAVFANFSETDLQLCFFHLKQSSYRKIQNLGLQAAYNDPENSDVRDFCHMMAGLAYVPVDHVKEAFLAVSGEAPDVPHIPEYIDYFKKNYVIGVPGAGRRRAVPPRYPPNLWNVYNATLEGKAATNNASEGWHNRFAGMLDKSHPDIYNLLEALKKEQGDTEISILELRMGRTIKAAPKKNG